MAIDSRSFWKRRFVFDWRQLRLIFRGNITVIFPRDYMAWVKGRKSGANFDWRRPENSGRQAWKDSDFLSFHRCRLNVVEIFLYHDSRHLFCARNCQSEREQISAHFEEAKIIREYFSRVCPDNPVGFLCLYNEARKYFVPDDGLQKSMLLFPVQKYKWSKMWEQTRPKIRCDEQKLAADTFVVWKTNVAFYLPVIKSDQIKWINM